MDLIIQIIHGKINMKGAAEFTKKRFDYPIVAVEIGVERGGNAEDMLSQMNIKRLYLVDDYKPYTDYLGGECPQDVQDWVYREMFRRVSRYFDKTVLVAQNSMFAVELFPDEFFDFIYIDGNHNYESVKQDLNAWWPKTKKCGVFSGHDFDLSGVADIRHDVTDAVIEFAKEKNLEYQTFVGDNPQFSDWVIIR